MVRSNRRTRTRGIAAAMLVAGGSALVGLGGVGSVGSAAAAVVVPSGGCWTYTPSGAGLGAAPSADLSSALGPWSSSGNGGVALTTSGPTADGSQRHVTVEITDGPVLSTSAATSGTLSILLSMDGTAVPTPIQVPFAAAAGAPITGVSGSADLPIDGDGAHTVGLVGIYLDDAALSLRMACNGQTDASASPGDNPATAPLATDLTATFTAVSGPELKVDSITDQAETVTSAARPADLVSLKASGFSSGAPATIEFCATAGNCSVVGATMFDAAGAIASSFMVPASVPAATGTLRLGDGSAQASVPFTLLGVQTMVASEKLGAKSTTITFAGTGWDPKRPVTLQGHVGASGATSKSTDSDVRVRPGATGAFTASYTVKDPDTVSIVAEQSRSNADIGSIYLTSGVVGSGGATDGSAGGGDGDGDGGDADGGDGTSTGSGSGTTTSTTTSSGTSTSGSSVSTPSATTPVAGGAAPVSVPGADATGELEISDVRLDGQDGLGALFGGAPTRTVVFVVENTGKTAVVAPVIRVAVARSTETKPLPVAIPMSDLPVGGRAIVSVPVELPPAAVGSYHVIVQVGDADSGTFKVRWSSFPWGLLTFNAIGLAILIVGLAPYVADRLPRRQPVPGLVRPAEGDAIVDLRAAERWWASRSAKTRSRAS